ncbi:DUF4352 domain-containing protein [Listeria rocourtiae]|uniref:DUF4352 domain-containing protein n=1 Tax=Listeria rocourtiae TaxID=647910 RepID=UPI0003E86FFC|nr:DUF4352 domain-containing protein [Listeria rocourtiae]EUJ47792.1 hypothetical protein PROCOU_07748 [Listeria rocourtiae FSL F6-920]
MQSRILIQKIPAQRRKIVKKSATDNNKSATDNKKVTASEPVVVNGIQLTLDKQEVTKAISKDQKEQNLYTFRVTGKNVSSINKGLGSADFILKTKDNKTLETDYNYAAFGGEIQPEKTLSGPVSFTLNKDQKATKLIYRIGKKEMMSWDVEN